MKTYVDVTVRNDKQENTHPLVMHWPDGRNFEIDRVQDVREAPALKAGGIGMRYKCRSMGREVNLFFDAYDGKWFVEHQKLASNVASTNQKQTHIFIYIQAITIWCGKH